MAIACISSTEETESASSKRVKASHSRLQRYPPKLVLQDPVLGLAKEVPSPLLLAHLKLWVTNRFRHVEQFQSQVLQNGSQFKIQTLSREAHRRISNPKWRANQNHLVRLAACWLKGLPCFKVARSQSHKGRKHLVEGWSAMQLVCLTKGKMTKTIKKALSQCPESQPSVAGQEGIRTKTLLQCGVHQKPSTRKSHSGFVSLQWCHLQTALL